MKKLLFLITFIIIHLSQIYSQSESGQKNIYLNTGARYVSGADGTIRMYVNIWGHISNPGRILVDEGIDIATLLSLSGGPNKGANFKKVRVYHEYPKKDGKIYVKPFKDQDSAALSVYSKSDVLIIREPNSPKAAKGSKIKAILTDN